MQPDRIGRSGVLSARTPRESREAEEAANAYWRGFQADQRGVTARGVAQVGAASYEDRQGWTVADAAVYEQTLSAIRARTRTNSVPPRADWPGGHVPETIPPGDLGGSTEPFDGFAEPKPKPAATNTGAGPRYLIQVPVVVLNGSVALGLACMLARTIRPVMPEADVLEVVVMRDGDRREPRRVFCGSVMGEGGRCARPYGHDGGHDPRWPAVAASDPGVP